MLLNQTQCYIQSLVRMQQYSYSILHTFQLNPPDTFISNIQTTTYKSPWKLELRFFNIVITTHMAAMHYGTPKITLSCSVINYVATKLKV